MLKLKTLVYPVVALFALAAVFAAHAAGAYEGEGSGVDGLVTQTLVVAKTRGQVRAELLQARVDGTIDAWAFGYNPLATAKSLTTRDAVRAEASTARAIGYEAMYREDSGAFYLAQQPQARDASRVLARGPAQQPR